MTSERRSGDGALPSCPELAWKIGLLVDGELSGHDREAMELHVLECPECGRTAEDFRSLDDLARLDEAPPVSAVEWSALRERVLASLGSQPAGGRDARPGEAVRRRDWARLPWLAAAAAALFLGGMLVGRAVWGPGPVSPGGSTPPPSVAGPAKDAAGTMDPLAERPVGDGARRDAGTETTAETGTDSETGTGHEGGEMPIRQLRGY